MTMFFTQIYIYDNNNKNIYILKYKKSLLYLLFEKSGKNIDRFGSSAPPVCFHSLFKDPTPPSTTNSLLKRGCCKGVNYNASAFMQLNIKTNK